MEGSYESLCWPMPILAPLLFLLFWLSNTAAPSHVWLLKSWNMANLSLSGWSQVWVGCSNKVPQTAWLLNNRGLLLTVLKAWKSTIRLWHGSHEGPPLDCGLLASPCVLTWQKEDERALRLHFIRALIPFTQIPPSWPNPLPKAHFLILSHRDLKFQHMNLGEHKHSVYCRCYKWNTDIRFQNEAQWYSFLCCWHAEMVIWQTC